ncbi:MAG: T9SS type A sorting domain-containing protein [Saprospiraceae bacterium]|nr:T9SS type A sorting domain-containing protein [Saprospiraceae bacterium]
MKHIQLACLFMLSGFISLTAQPDSKPLILIESGTPNASIPADFQKRFRYTYDNHGNEVAAYIDLWESNQWTPSFRDSKTYNQANDLTFILGQRWDAATQTWIDSTQTKYEYALSGHYSLRTLERYTSGQWIKRAEEELIYTPSGQLAEITSKIYNPAGALMFQSRNTYSYDNQNRVLDNISESIFNGMWGYTNKVEYQYNSPNPDEYVSFQSRWNFVTLSWSNPDNKTTRTIRNDSIIDLTQDFIPGAVNSILQIRQLNTEGYKFKQESFIWKNDQWGIYNGIEFDFNPDQTYHQIRYYFTDAASSTPGALFLNLKQEFLYTLTDVKNALPMSQMRIWPNPVSDFLHLQTDDTSAPLNSFLFDRTGRLIGQYGNQYSIPVGQLPTGEYWLSIEQGGQFQTIPVLKN